MGFYVLMLVKMTIFFWIVTSWRLAGRFSCFGETFCLQLQGQSGGDGKKIPALYKLSTSKHCQFSLEDRNSLFPSNTAIYLQVYTVSQPRTTMSTISYDFFYNQDI
jgi:hypothetical protein